MFKKIPKIATDEPSPWLDIAHTHEPLPANDGKEMVCGLCGLRESVKDLKELS